MSEEGANHKGPVKITISDPVTSAVLEEKVVENNYVLITVGNRYLKSMQMWGNTHQLNIAVCKPERSKS